MTKKPDPEPKVKLYRISTEIEATSIDEARLLARSKPVADRLVESVSRVTRAKYSSRASRLDEAASMVEDAKSIVDELRDEMQEWYDNLPENFQNGEKGEQLESAKDGLEELAGQLEEADFTNIEFPGMY